MNGIESITARILSDANVKREELLAEADCRAAEIILDAERAAEKVLDEAKQEAESQSAAFLEREAQSAEIESRRIVSSHKRDLVSKAFDKAYESLLNLPDDAYYETLLQYARRAKQEEPGELVLNERDRARFGDRLAQESGLALSGETANIAGGLIVRYGPIEYNCSFEVILRQLSESLAYEVSQTLFAL